MKNVHIRTVQCTVLTFYEEKTTKARSNFLFCHHAGSGLICFKINTWHEHLELIQAEKRHIVMW